MTPEPPTGRKDDPTTALQPWTVGAVLCLGAGAWVVLELLWRVAR